MKKQRTVLEVLFPLVRAELLRLLFAPPQRERYVRELMRMSGLTLSTVQDELRKLSALELVTSRSNRYHRFYRANYDHPLFSDLLHIVEISEKAPQVNHSILHPPRQARPRRRTPEACRQVARALQEREHAATQTPGAAPQRSSGNTTAAETQDGSLANRWKPYPSATPAKP